jgi:hypothetical protein
MPVDLYARPWHPAANPSGLTELEVASGVVMGKEATLGLTPDGSVHPVEVLRNIARRLLATPPCVIAFSGGRDSSALLALFIDVARRDGLPEPIAITARWDEDAASNENAWQENVISSIGASHWEIIRPGTDLDLLGSEATSVLGQMGLMWPAPAYAFLPMVRHAAGGVFVSGEGGDEAFGLWPYGQLWATLRQHRAPGWGELKALTLGSCPPFVRRLWWRHKLPPYQDWLQPQAFRRVSRILAEELSNDPFTWVKYQMANRQSRGTEISLRTFEALCATQGATYAGPFLDSTFLGALAAWGGRFGVGDRTAAMTSLFSEVLPGGVLGRRTKASFGGVFWGPASRQFAHDWDGSGLSDELVDREALRGAWLAPVPVYGAAIPLHAAWLAQCGTLS